VPVTEPFGAEVPFESGVAAGSPTPQRDGWDQDGPR
jgi:hypothetical protein